MTPPSGVARGKPRAAGLTAVVSTGVSRLGVTGLFARGLGVTGLFALGLCAAPLGQAAAASAPADLSASSFVKKWSAGPLVQDTGAPFALSSPTVADLDGTGPAVVVGDRAGYLYAFHLSDGTAVQGWPVFDGGAPIDSPPSAAPLPGSTYSTVFVGSGNAQHPDEGSYQAYSPSGQRLWSTAVTDLPSDSHPAYAVQAGLTVADVQANLGVFAGSLDQLSYGLDASTGAVLPGWPFFSADSVFSTAASADLYGDGQEELVVGGASTAGLANGQSYAKGGHVRVLGTNGALMYDYDTDQEVDSSPAVGDFLAANAPGIVVGTGSYYAGASQTDTVLAFNSRLGLVWSQVLDGLTSSSPALADLQGDGQLDVVEGTQNGASGSVWALDGATGTPVWHQTVVGRVIGSVVTADITGTGYQDVLVPTTHGVEVLDGRDGTEVTVLGSQLGFQSSPLVTDDPNGSVGITIAGYNGDNQGVVQHYEVKGTPSGAVAVGPGSWPMFHHDPQLSGTSSALAATGTVSPSGLAAQASNGQVTLTWSPPAGQATVSGYNVYEATAPGRETGAPINGLALVSGTSYTVSGLAPGHRYYFEVTAVDSGGEGAPSNEAVATIGAPSTAPVPVPPGPPQDVAAAPGDAAVTLTWQPPVPNGGQAPTSYEVLVSTAAGAQAQPLATVTGTTYTAANLLNGTTYYFEVVAVNPVGPGALSEQVSATPVAPPGYRVAASDGEVFSFGKLVSYGSAKPGSAVVGLAETPDANGYWRATKDGGVLTAGDAHSYGSLSHLHLNSPVVAIAATPDGRGYWLVSADGGVFAFGDAGFHGSLGSSHLEQPVVAMAVTPDGQGYWMVTSSGAVYPFGDARPYGSLSGYHLNSPVVAMAVTGDGRGYWLVSADGGVFAFGDAGFHGSLGASRLKQPVVGLAVTPDQGGYWMVTAAGAVYRLGDAQSYGSAVPSRGTAVAIAG